MRKPSLRYVAARSLLLLAAFLVLAAAITTKPSKRLRDFDQSFYTTIAYDLDRYGVFSNGMFDDTNSARAEPAPGMFFVPGYPLLVLAAMKIDPRFETAVRCSVESNHELRSESECEDYARPMHLIHALLLGIGVLAIALAAETIFGSARVFWLAGALATASLAAEADLFSFIMTESMTISLFCVVTLFALWAWKTMRLTWFALAGAALGLLCLTRPSFVVLIPVLLGLTLLQGIRRAPGTAARSFKAALLLLVACLLVVGPWIVRNQSSVGKSRLTEEYGAAALIERFAYNDMTPGEFASAFAYCVPGLGDALFDKVDGSGSMHRFVYHTDNSFFHAGRSRRDALVEQHVRLDPIISGIALDEMRADWWRHLLVSIPLAWCGMWAGGLWSLALVPLFGWACIRAARTSRPLFLLYAAPAVVMLGVHAAIGNHYTRYNLILIGPYCVGAAWLLQSLAASVRSRWRAPVPAR